jgi:pSer/pThr/pTyr-binding forkhead associated (FHA) protein
MLKARLLYRDAHGFYQAVDLAGEVFIGRSHECVIRIEDGLTSRRHARIFESGERYWIEDLGSANGTFVNEVRVAQPVSLAENDVLRCGNSFIRYVDEQRLKVVVSASLPPQAPAAAPVVVAPPLPIAPAAQGTPVGIQAPFAAPIVDKEQLDAAQARIEELEKDARRLRTEHESVTRRLEEAKTQLGETEAALDAQRQLGEDHVAELAHHREETSRMTVELGEAREDLASRQRQLARALEDVARAKEETDRARRELAECVRARDASLKKVNDDHAEIEELREVIREQCTMLEEQRVRLMVLEDAQQRRMAVAR